MRVRLPLFAFLLAFTGSRMWAQNPPETRVVERVPNFSGIEVLSKATPQELKNYPFRVLGAVRNKWFRDLQQLQHSPGWKQGTTVIEIEIKRGGSLEHIKTVESAGDSALDNAATQAIQSAAPFPTFPDSYRDKTMRLRIHFGYDPPTSPDAPFCNGPNLGSHTDVDVLRRADKGVTPPHATKVPDPEYSEKARRMKYQSHAVIAGTVDQQGTFTDACVLVPAGRGLDERAIAAVRTWQFEPARLDGTPKAVRISVEVDFRLY